LARQAPASTITPGTRIVAQMILSRFSFTHGMLPRKKPAVTRPTTQMPPPTTL
jgi:hypothetical protein